MCCILILLWYYPTVFFILLKLTSCLILPSFSAKMNQKYIHSDGIRNLWTDSDVTPLLNGWKEMIWFLEHGDDWNQNVDISEFFCFIHDFVILSHIQPKSNQNTTDGFECLKQKFWFMWIKYPWHSESTFEASNNQAENSAWQGEMRSLNIFISPC